MTPNVSERRKPVWLALSEFFTDPQPTAADMIEIANVLRNQDITFAQAEEICTVEVAPAFMGSIVYAFHPAFMWGVDADDLHAEILRRYNPRRLPKLLFSTRLWRFLVKRVVGKHLTILKLHLG